MRVAVFGHSGMLGRYVVKALQASDHVAIPIHRLMFELASVISVKHVLEDSQAEAIINCAGVIPARNSNVLDMIQVNGAFPHILTEAAAPLPVILVSTDCVFSGRNRYRYTTDDIPDPRDYYGVTKRLGEVAAQNAIVVRTSFMGCEHGWMNTVLQAGALAKSSGRSVTMSGWKNALWTGSTVQAVGAALVNDVLTNTQNLHGLVHLSTEKTTSKYDVAVKLVEIYDLNIEVKADYYPVVNRALKATVILKDMYEALEEYKCREAQAAA